LYDKYHSKTHKVNSLLPEYAIDELMKETALEYRINIQASSLHEFKKLVRGNPRFAICAITQGRSKLMAEIEKSTPELDITPLIIINGIILFLVRFVFAGKDDPKSYIFVSICSVLIISACYLMQMWPQE
jgi:hypothetical protein